MMSEGSADAPRRMHPSSVIFRIGAFLRQLAFPLILVLLFASGETMELYASALAIPLAIYEIWRYWTTTYRITNDQLIVRQGVLFRSERYIPLVRVQNVDLVQNFFHRLLSVAEVRIETASGSEPEAVLKVLGLDEVDRMRQQIFSRRMRSADTELAEGTQLAETQGLQPQPAEEQPVELLHLPLGELVKLGIITYRGLAIVGAGDGPLRRIGRLPAVAAILKVLLEYDRQPLVRGGSGCHEQ